MLHSHECCYVLPNPNKSLIHPGNRQPDPKHHRNIQIPAEEIFGPQEKHSKKTQVTSTSNIGDAVLEFS